MERLLRSVLYHSFTQSRIINWDSLSGYIEYQAETSDEVIGPFRFGELLSSFFQDSTLPIPDRSDEICIPQGKTLSDICSSEGRCQAFIKAVMSDLILPIGETIMVRLLLLS